MATNIGRDMTSTALSRYDDELMAHQDSTVKSFLTPDQAAQVMRRMKHASWPGTVLR
jgi:hypothetical protein